jgi:hypothetical protein
MQSIFGEQNLFWLGVVAASVLLLGWFIFFIAAMRTRENLKTLIDGTFLQNLTVILVVAATAYLTLTGLLKPELSGSIVSGIVGYVLGTIKQRQSSEH